MTINEYILLGNLGLSIFLVWRITKANKDIEMLFEGLAITMNAAKVK